jgi:type I restriction enzyme S subunit
VTQPASDWATVRLDRLFRERKQPAREHDPLVTAFIDGRVTLRSNRPDAIIKSSGQEAGYKHLEVGDLVISAMNAHLGGLGISDSEGKCTPVYIVLQPIREIDQRFISYSLWNLAATGFIRSLVNAVRYNSADFRPETVKAIDILLPPVPEQRRIADFLDDQVSRIDQVIALRRSQMESVTRRPWLQFGQAIAQVACEPAQLRRFLIFITDGPFGSAFTSEDYVDAGHPVVRLGNVGFAEFKTGDVAFVPPSVFGRFPRCHVEPGDLLIASLGDERNHAGRATLAPTMPIQAMVKGKCFCARVDHARVDADFVAILLSSPFGADNMTRLGQGSTRQMINLQTVKESLWPMPDLDGQRQLRIMFRTSEAKTKALAGELELSCRLLQERKRALIAAAVTGEFDVTTGTGRGVA